MRTARIRYLLLGVAALLLSGVPGRAEDTNHFPLQDGDTWVMGGDSITAQHLHSNYFEAFCYARYPNLKFRFRNSGVGGDTIPKLMARFDWDVAAWKPTVVSVELGMNDQGGYSVEQYLDNMGKLTQQIQTIKARPVFFTASPINNGATMTNLDGNAKLNAYAVALKKFAEEQKAPFADQFHALLDPWGKNKPRENLANSLNVLKAIAHDDKLAGVEHLRAFLEEQARSPHAPVAMQGDAVHPGPPGQLTMAAALLKDLDAMGFVSNAVLDDTGKVLAAKGCQVSDVKAADGKLTFDRLDECLPFPIPDEARAVLPLYPTILDLSQYGLQVKGLKGSRFALKVNGIALGNGTIEDLEKGVNLTVYGKGPLADQGKAILNAVAAKEGLVGQWRGLSRTASAPGASADTRERLVELTKKVEDADAKIRVAAKPRKLHFEVTAVTDVGK